jgi:iron complex outermembrane receptor protein
MSAMADGTSALARAVAAVLAGSCIAGLVPRVALAQDGGADAPQFEEVVVTAQHREQSVQDVPITMNVINDDLLNDVTANDLGDLNGFVPGLLVRSTSPTQPVYQIRGIRTADFGIGTDPAIGVYVNGVYMARSGASLLTFNDVERIEVLRGRRARCSGATARRVRSRSSRDSRPTISTGSSSSGWATTASSGPRAWSTCRCPAASHCARPASGTRATAG